MAPSAHVSHPADGTVLLFPGDRLHGVCPAVASAVASAPKPTQQQRPRAHDAKEGVAASRKRARAAQPAPHGGDAPNRSDPPLAPPAELPRRVTLMIGFYTRNVHREVARRPRYSACARMPRATRACTWPTVLANSPLTDAAEAAAISLPTRHLVPLVCPAWEGVPAASGAAAADEDPWAAHGLHVPEERNNHYFVRGMHEFAFDHLGEGDDAD